MDLWTEFEGVTIDSAFALNKLLQTEGRSAFFSTLNASGESVLIRIIECHFDEDEILARWRGVQTLGHPNFLRIDRFSQFLIEEDGITAVYAVFERVDANLGEVLEKGRLAVPEAAQIGLSIASALETLHANGFVHQHVEARNIYAVGETVKLRSDCIRETPEGQAGMAARCRDVHDLAVVLEQVLMGMIRGFYTGRQASLPAPFDEIVGKGMSGEWGLAEMQTALRACEVPKKPVAKSASPKAAPLNAAQAKPAIPVTPMGAAAISPLLRDAVSRAVSSEKPAQGAPESRSEARSESRPESRAEGRPWAQRRSAESSGSVGRAAFLRRERARFELPAALSNIPQQFRPWIAGGVFLAIVMLVGWIVMHSLSGSHQAAAAGSPAQAAKAPLAVRTAAPRASSSQPAVAPRAASRKDVQWRVVAYTYKRQDQAQKKAASLAQSQPMLQPQVFSPSGKAPWLVTIGGPLERDAAYALARKARSLGLPRDTYAQNYRAQ